MRPVNRGVVPTDSDGNPVKFKAYGDARDDLISRLGGYCSYCEIYLPMALAVEHIQPKSLEPTLEKEWSNFLLSCPSCNSIKGAKVINALNLHNYFWVHSDNTFRAFVYEKDRSPQVATSLNDAQQQIAQNTLELTGLNREPEPTNRQNVKDPRWKARKDVWEIAKRHKEYLSQQPTEITRNLIIENAISRGFWSVWMTVFEDYTDMRRRLIEAFQGTCKECFDLDTQPVQRTDGKI